MSAFNNYALFTRMPSGIPGAITRHGVGETVEPMMQSASGYPTSYGIPVAISSSDSGARMLTAGDTGDSAYGFIARPFPISDNSGASPALGTSTPPTSGLVDIMKRGYINVLLNGTASATKGGKVYCRIANPSTGKVVGGIEAANDIGVVGTPYASNTGNGTISILSAQDATPTGNYIATFTSATKYNVTDASGEILGAGTTGTQITLDNGLSFKITAGGTAFVANDYFTVAVTDNTVLLPRAYFTGAADGSNNAEVAFHI